MKIPIPQNIIDNRLLYGITERAKTVVYCIKDKNTNELTLKRSPYHGGQILIPYGNCRRELFSNTYLPYFYQKFNLSLEDGEYYRWVHSIAAAKKEFSLIESGQLNPSKNINTNRYEDGLSVSYGPWFYWSNFKFCYKIKGKCLTSTGSDEETLLDIKSLKPIENINTSFIELLKFSRINKHIIETMAKTYEFKNIDILRLIFGQVNSW